MSKGQNQKLKLLYIMRLLKEKSDEQHPVPVSEIIRYLEENEVSAERKSIYSDIEALRVYGLDIIWQRGTNGGYYIASREFDLSELKLLVDCVRLSKFITQKKIHNLIIKIENFANIYEAQFLNRQVYIKNRVKTMDESIYHNLDEIYGAILGDSKIIFRYAEYSVGRERILRHAGTASSISPFALIWEDEKYYLAAYDSAEGIVKYLRVDRMAEIKVLNEKRDGQEFFEDFDLTSHCRMHFGVHNGKEEKVTLEFDNSMAGEVIDRFGRDVSVSAIDGEHFRICTEVNVSPQFFGWLCTCGQGVRIISPTEVVDQMREHVNEIAEMYCYA